MVKGIVKRKVLELIASGIREDLVHERIGEELVIFNSSDSNIDRCISFLEKNKILPIDKIVVPVYSETYKGSSFSVDLGGYLT